MRPGRPLVPPFLVGALASVMLGCKDKGSSFHSLAYVSTGVSEEPSRGLPRFFAVGYVDDQQFIQYDSRTRKAWPKGPWMETLVEVEPQWLDLRTQRFRGSEDSFRETLESIRNDYNHSKDLPPTHTQSPCVSLSGFHSLQGMFGCEQRPGGSKGGHEQWAYDGRDYISFDKDSLTWTAADPMAQITKRKWEADPAMVLNYKTYQEKECIEELEKLLEYGEQRLLRTERPEGKVTHKEGYGDTETLVFQAYGFYPKEIDVTWRKDGEVLHEGTFHKNVAPYPDGTYHAWLSIEINPKERDQYQCHVDHASLGEPLVLAWAEKPGPNLGLIVVRVVLAVLLIASPMAGIYFCKTSFQPCSSFHQRAPPMEGAGASGGLPCLDVHCLRVESSFITSY